jgi:hypothetical protein
MKTHRTIQKNLYGYLTEELPADERRATEHHLKSCVACAKELQSIREAMDLVTRNSRKPSEQRSELYWQQFADKVDRRIRMASAQADSQSFVGRLLDLLADNRKPISFGFASAVSLMVLAFGVWSLWIKAPNPDRAASDAAVQKMNGLSSHVDRTAMEVRAENYLEQSKVLLIGIMNTETKSLIQSKPLLDRQQEMSRVLVRESQEISSGLTDPSQQRLRELVSDLGLILIQLANIESKHGVEGVEIVKGGVERNGILFKINLEEIQRASQPARNNKELEKQEKSTI